MNISRAIVRKRYTDHTLFYSAILTWKLLFFLPLLMYVNSGSDHVFRLYFVPYLTVIVLFRVMTYFATYKASFMEMTEMGLSVFLIIADFYLVALFDIHYRLGWSSCCYRSCILLPHSAVFVGFVVGFGSTAIWKS